MPTACLTDLNAVVIRDIAALSAIRHDWDTLLAKAPEATAFLSYDWIMDHLNIFPANDIFLVAVYDDARQLVGLAPFKIASLPVGLFKRSLRCLIMMGCNPNVTDYTQVMIDPTLERSAVLETIAQELREYQHEYQAVWLDRYRDSQDLQILTALLSSGELSFFTRDSEVLPTISLPATYEEYDKKQRSKRLRKTINNIQNRIKTDLNGEKASLEWVEDAQERDAILKNFFGLNRSYWRGRGKPSSFDRYAGFSSFMHSTIDKLIGKGWDDSATRVSVIRLQGEIISYHLGFIGAGRYIAYMANYSDDASKYKPGLLHFERLIEASIEQGFHTFEFGIGDEPYKQLWAPRMEIVSLLYGSANPLTRWEVCTQWKMQDAFRDFKKQVKAYLEERKAKKEEATKGDSEKAKEN